MASSGTAMSVVSLREYLSGHLEDRALRVFEDALNEPVKEGMRNAFPEEEDDQEAQDYAIAMEVYEKELAEAKERVNVTQDAIRGLARNEGKLLRKEASTAKKQLAALAKYAPIRPCPLWLRKAKSTLGSRMVNLVDANSAWDTCMLVAILCGFLEEVFVGQFSIDDPLVAKDLLSRLLRASESRNRRAHGTMHTESEALDLIFTVATSLRLCGLDEDAGKVGDILNEAHDLIGAAEDSQDGQKEVPMNAAEQELLLMYRAIRSFEQQLEIEAGRFYFKNGTYDFGTKSLEWACDDQHLVKLQRSRLKEVAEARHWVFHHTSITIDGEKVLASMGAIINALRGIKVRNECPDPVSAAACIELNDLAEDVVDLEWTWTWPCRVDMPKTVCVLLQLSDGGMSIPVPRAPYLVGRREVIKEITETLLDGESSRVLVYGSPGVGKDVVASEVVRTEAVVTSGIKLQAWLQGSTDGMLRQQLVGLFRAHRPNVINRAGEVEDEQLTAICRWLATHDSWLLVVEDAGWACRALWDYIPTGKGRLLVTSQVLLSGSSSDRVDGQCTEGQDPLPNASAFRLEGLSLSASLQLLRSMNVFAKTNSHLVDCSSEVELQYMCSKLDEDDAYVFATESETGEECKIRHSLIMDSLITERRGRKQRLRQLVAAQQEYWQLVHRSGIRRFLVDNLGNLPLSVTLCGDLLRSVGNVDSLMDLYTSVSLQNIDRDGRNPMTDRHYLGAARSVLLSVRKMQTASLTAWPAVQRLMYALSLLPSRETPASLFVCEERTDYALIALFESTDVEYQRAALFEGAKDLLFRYGLAEDKGHTRAPGMHQLVQQVLRERPPDHEVFDSVLRNIREVLMSRLSAADRDADHKDMWALLPCAVWRCTLTLRESSPDQLTDVEELEFQNLAADLLIQQGQPSQALNLLSQLLQVLPSRFLYPSTSETVAEIRLWGSFANACYGLGRHEVAMAMQEEVLELRRRSLAREHPDIATSMNHLAWSYFALGRHEEAMAMQEEVLELRRRILPCEHPDIATSMNHLAWSYSVLGRHEEAMAMQEEVLQLRRRVQPSEHPGIATSVNHLGSSYPGGEHSMACSCLLARQLRDSGVKPLDIAVSIMTQAYKNCPSGSRATTVWQFFIAAHVAAVHLGDEAAHDAARQIASHADLHNNCLPAPDFLLLLAFLLEERGNSLDCSTVVLETLRECWTAEFAPLVMARSILVSCIKSSVKSLNIRAVSAACSLIQLLCYNDVARASFFSNQESAIDLLRAAAHMDVARRRHACLAIAHVCFLSPESQALFQRANGAQLLKRLLPATTIAVESTKGSDLTTQALIDALNYMFFTDHQKRPLVDQGVHVWAIDFLMVASAHLTTVRACCNLLRGMLHLQVVQTALSNVRNELEPRLRVILADVEVASKLLKEWLLAPLDAPLEILPLSPLPSCPEPTSSIFQSWRSHLLSAAEPFIYDAYLAQDLSKSDSLHLQLVTTGPCQPPPFVIIKERLKVPVKVMRRGQIVADQWVGRSWRAGGVELLSRHTLSVEEARIGAQLVDHYAADLFLMDPCLSAVVVDASRLCKGERVRGPCIALYVRHKGVLSCRSKLLPASLSYGSLTMATDIREGEFCRQAENNNRELQPALVSGVSINASVQRDFGGCTLGAIARKDGRLGIITTAHGVADGCNVFHPASIYDADSDADGDSEAEPRTLVAVSEGEASAISREETNDFLGMHVTVDAAFLPLAVGTPNDPQGFSSTRRSWGRPIIREALRLTSINQRPLVFMAGQPFADEEVWKDGMASGVTHGMLCIGGGTGAELPPFAVSDRFLEGDLYQGQLLVEPLADVFSLRGDSGSLVVTIDRGTCEAAAVGLLVGAVGRYTLVTPIQAVLNQLGAELIFDE